MLCIIYDVNIHPSRAVCFIHNRTMTSHFVDEKLDKRNLVLYLGKYSNLTVGY
jgi:hypothetical protein